MATVSWAQRGGQPNQLLGPILSCLLDFALLEHPFQLEIKGCKVVLQSF